jgi:regulator of RNase E activity RraB
VIARLALAALYATKVRALGLAVDVGDEEDDWDTTATKSMLLVADEITALAEQLKTVAAAEGGEYDGWGAAVVN